MRPVYTYINNLLSKEECERIIEIQSHKLETSTVFSEVSKTDNIYNKIRKNLIRKTKVSWISPGSEFDPIIQRILDAVKYVAYTEHDMLEIGNTENVQFAEYGFLSHYSKHLDVGIKGSHRVISTTVQLTDPNKYIGGKLILELENENKIPPQTQGTVVIFPSIIPHKVTPILYGKRHSLALWTHLNNINK